MGSRTENLTDRAPLWRRLLLLWLRRAYSTCSTCRYYAFVSVRRVDCGTKQTLTVYSIAQLKRCVSKSFESNSIRRLKRNSNRFNRTVIPKDMQLMLYKYCHVIIISVRSNSLAETCSIADRSFKNTMNRDRRFTVTCTCSNWKAQTYQYILDRLRNRIMRHIPWHILNATSTHMRLPPEFKHINKGRKRN